MNDKQDKAIRLLDALGELDSKALTEAFETDSADKLRAKVRKNGFTSPRQLRRIASLAACLIIVISALSLFPIIDTHGLPIGGESQNDGEPPEVQLPEVAPAETSKAGAAPVISSVAAPAPQDPPTPGENEPSKDIPSIENALESSSEESEAEAVPIECPPEASPDGF